MECCAASGMRLAWAAAVAEGPFGTAAAIDMCSVAVVAVVAAVVVVAAAAVAVVAAAAGAESPVSGPMEADMESAGSS